MGVYGKFNKRVKMHLTVIEVLIPHKEVSLCCFFFLLFPALRKLGNCNKTTQRLLFMRYVNFIDCLFLFCI